MKHLTAALAALLVGLTLAPPDATACSYPSAGWHLPYSMEQVSIQPGEPLAVVLQGVGNPWDDVPPVKNATFDVTVTGPEGEVDGAVEVRPAALDHRARLLWTPAEPLQEGVDYDVEIESASDQARGSTELLLDVATVEGEPSVGVQQVKITEREALAGEKQCCAAASEDDPACQMDSCGGYPRGEECRICWNTEYAYPIGMTLSWELQNVSNRGRFDHRVLLVDESGEELETVFETVGRSTGNAGPGFEQDATGPFCAKVVVEDVLSDAVYESEVVCRDTEDVERLQRRTPDNSDSVNRCAAGTYVKLDEDGTEVAIPRREVDGSGGCGCDSAKSSPASWLSMILLLLSVFGLRRLERLRGVEGRVVGRQKGKR